MPVFVAKQPLVKAAIGSTGAGRPNFVTTQWGLVATASSEGAAEPRAALDALYRTYCYPIYAFIRRRGYDRQDAQDLTQDFFVHLLEKGTLGRADRQRGRFRSFLLGALNHFLAHSRSEPALGSEAATASLFTLTTTRRRTATNSQRLKV